MKSRATHLNPKKPDAAPRLGGVLLLLYRMHPRRALLVVFLLLLAGLFEGMGVLSLLPLLGIAADSGAASAVVPDALTRVLEFFSISPSLGVLVLILVFGVVAKAVFFVLGLRQAGYAAADTAAQLRNELFEALMKARWDYFASQQVGALTNAAGSEAIRAASLYSQCAYLVAGAVQVGVYLVLAFAVSWKITLGALVFVTAIVYLLRSFVSRSRLAGQHETAMLKSIISRLTEGLAAIKPLKAMALENSMQPLLAAEAEELNQAQRQQSMNRAITAGIHEPLIAIFLGIGMYLLVGRAGVPFEQLAFMAIVSHRIVTRTGNTQTYYLTAMTVESAFRSIRSAIADARDAAEITRGADPPALEESIVFDQIVFGYGTTVVLDDLSLTIGAGTITAVSGPSGVGKTTFVDLLIGLFQPESGRILIDGVPLNDIDLRKWRSMIGYVPQEVLLLHQAIGQNVSLGRSDVSSIEIEEALRAAGAWEFVSALPDGMDTLVGERGIRLSGGQRQRIAIARALVRKPRLLILDEATTALDPITERSICATLEMLRPEMTIVAVSHQAAIVDVADEVFRLKKPDRASVPS